MTTRRDYLAIANALRKEYQTVQQAIAGLNASGSTDVLTTNTVRFLEGQRAGISRSATAIANALLVDNAHFPYDLFLSVVHGDVPPDTQL